MSVEAGCEAHAKDSIEEKKVRKESQRDGDVAAVRGIFFMQSREMFCTSEVVEGHVFFLGGDSEMRIRLAGPWVF